MPFALLPYPAIDPEIVSIGPFALRWYALAYVLGILVGWWAARRLVVADGLWRGRARPAPLDIDDFVVWATLGIVIGGRLGYVLFYKPAEYLANPAEIVFLWHGGMSFHGGLIGVLVAMLLFARKRHIDLWSLVDVACAVVPIGLRFGRLANFVNGELYGRPTDSPLAMIFPTDPTQTPRHPSQLYEAALEGLVLFLVLQALIRLAGGLSRPGFVAGAFTAGYGIARIVSELFREPDAHIGFLTSGLTMGILLSLPMVLIGAGVMVWSWQHGTRDAGRSDGGDGQ